MRIAAVDLGTSSFHLLVVDGRPDGTFVPLVREKEMLRLGDDVAREGRISPDGERRAIETLRRFCALAERAGAARIVACATSAFREAANARRLVETIETETGIRPRVIDGEEEARLIYRAIRASVVVEGGPALGLDLGGGSLEVMVGDGAALHWAASLPLGIARLSTELVRHDPPSGGDRRRLRDRLCSLLSPVAEEVGRHSRRLAGHASGPTLAVGSGGTFCDFARMIAFRRSAEAPVPVNQFRFTRHEFLELHHELFDSTAVDAGLGPADRERVVKLAALLRVAAALDRGRTQAVEGLDGARGDTGARPGLAGPQLRARAVGRPASGRSVPAGVRAPARGRSRRHGRGTGASLRRTGRGPRPRAGGGARGLRARGAEDAQQDRARGAL